MAKEEKGLQEAGNKSLAKQDDFSPNKLLEIAVNKDADIEKLKQLMDLQERWEANQAKKEYARAFAVVQSQVESVVKKHSNQQTNSKYEALEDVIDMVKPLYTANGFSLTFYEGENAPEGHMRICVDVLHEAGHEKTYHYDTPLDGIGLKGNPNMTKVHGKASTVTYGRRYLTKMIFNIPTEDNDGNTQTFVEPEKGLEIMTKLQEVNGDEKRFLAHIGAESFKEITEEQYQKGLKAIEEKRGKK